MPMTMHEFLYFILHTFVRSASNTSGAKLLMGIAAGKAADNFTIHTPRHASHTHTHTHTHRQLDWRLMLLLCLVGLSTTSAAYCYSLRRISLCTGSTIQHSTGAYDTKLVAMATSLKGSGKEGQIHNLRSNTYKMVIKSLQSIQCIR